MLDKKTKILIDSDSPQERRGFLKRLAGLAVASTAMGGFTNLFAKKNSGELTAAFGTEDYMASIAMFGGNFAPRNWAFCNGQLIAISQNTALFSLLGTTFGGDGRTTFALPDLRGRVPIHEGTGPGLTTRILGQRSGSETNTLSALQLPVHTHQAIYTPAEYTAQSRAFVGRGTIGTDPTNSVLAKTAPGNELYSTSDANTDMGATSVSITQSSGGSVTIDNAGGSQPFNNMQPWLCVNFIICLFGIFPPRN